MTKRASKFILAVLVAVILITVASPITANAGQNFWSSVSTFTGGRHLGGEWRSMWINPNYSNLMTSETIGRFVHNNNTQGHATAVGTRRVYSGWRNVNVLARAGTGRAIRGNETWWNLR